MDCALTFASSPLPCAVRISGNFGEIENRIQSETRSVEPVGQSLPQDQTVAGEHQPDLSPGGPSFTRTHCDPQNAA